ncbi:class I SAM-dependent methyltransferase [Arenibaculum sp.]|jgi:SAM-dependent methyltransferase|uniref:class I SAM-dependent methyltransferase n=1 Tax=Arenibaculum sp. TaxID=2865862 RepID=UPI002E0FF3EA|nr:class I SAM-dependent methyltransferase [Arenibaculum sp.]
MPAVTDLDAHERVLVEHVFETETKTPHFGLLLRDLRRLSSELPEGAVVVSLERTLLYGGVSLFAPYFAGKRLEIVDCSPPSADERGAYNAAMVNRPDFIQVRYTRRAPIEETGLDSASADLVIVPNLVHHVADQDKLFGEMARILKPGGRAYVFEPILRELHQIPDDYLRYTPYGVQQMFRKVGLEPEGFEIDGGPFTAIAYCWIQALQHFPPGKREEMEEWFYGRHFGELLGYEAEYPKNLFRRHTHFAVSFSTSARKA